MLLLLKLQAISPEVRDPLIKGVFADCKTKEGASDVDLEEAFARKAPSTPAGKCLHACVHDVLGMVKGGKLLVPELSEMINQGFDDKKVAATMVEVVQDCKGVTDADRCEMAGRMFHCFAENMAKRGLDSNNLGLRL